MRDLIPAEIVSAPVVSDLYALALSECVKGGLYAEFGVFRGNSLRAIRRLLPIGTRLFGFDSFEGLPDIWNGVPAGTFRTDYRVQLPNTELVEGRFEETLPRFLAHNKEHASFLYIDCDLYQSAKTVLEAFASRLVPGSVIVFDELFGFSGYEKHEWRALEESALKYEVIGRWNAYRAAIRIV